MTTCHCGHGPDDHDGTLCRVCGCGCLSRETYDECVACDCNRLVFE